MLFTKNKIFHESKTYLEKSDDKDTSAQCIHMLCVIYRELMDQVINSDPFLEIPPITADSQEEQGSFMVKAL